MSTQQMPFQKRPYFGGFFQQQLRANLGQMAFKDSVTASDIHPNFPILSGPLTAASLPTTSKQGDLAIVTDSNTNTWGATVAGGGTDTVLAWWSGTAWTVIGK